MTSMNSSLECSLMQRCIRVLSSGTRTPSSSPPSPPCAVTATAVISPPAKTVKRTASAFSPRLQPAALTRASERERTSAAKQAEAGTTSTSSAATSKLAAGSAVRQSSSPRLPPLQLTGLPSALDKLLEAVDTERVKPAAAMSRHEAGSLAGDGRDSTTAEACSAIPGVRSAGSTQRAGFHREGLRAATAKRKLALTAAQEAARGVCRSSTHSPSLVGQDSQAIGPSSPSPHLPLHPVRCPTDCKTHHYHSPSLRRTRRASVSSG